MPRQTMIEKLIEKAAKDYADISDIHKKLLKMGYNKPYCVFIEEIKARVTYRKLFE